MSCARLWFLGCVGLNSILLINRHIQQDKDIYGTGSDRKLKAYINHLLKVTARDQGQYKGPSGAFVTHCNISCCIYIIAMYAPIKLFSQ